MGMNTSKKYTVRVHYLDVKSNDTDILEEKDVKLKDIPRIIRASVSAIGIGGFILDLPFTISKIEVELNK